MGRIWLQVLPKGVMSMCLHVKYSQGDYSETYQKETA